MKIPKIQRCGKLSFFSRGFSDCSKMNRNNRISEKMLMVVSIKTALLFFLLLIASSSQSSPSWSTYCTAAFVISSPAAAPPCRMALAATTSSNNNNKCTPLPAGLSPFVKSQSKGLDLQGTFRKIATTALQRAVQDLSSSTKAIACFEVEFPPLIGSGDTAGGSKSQFDDFDNISELNANADWCVQWAPLVNTALGMKDDDNIWLVFPDDKECELAKKQWTGQRYRQAAKFTSIRAAVSAVTTASSSSQSKTTTSSEPLVFAKAWGSSFASAVNKMQGGDGILADSSTLDELNVSNNGKNDKSKRLHIVCQPGNGGPVEDWINVQTLHTSSSNTNNDGVMTCIVNGALDKVRDGYYPALFFPALAKASQSFYQESAAKVQTVFYLKPITDKGLYGWLFYVYGEPWQVVLQTATQKQDRDGGSTVRTVVQDTIALLSAKRPTYQQAVQALVKTALTMNRQK
jgi:Domain of unknown function (DUF1995)